MKRQNKLTLKQESFCQAYVETGSASAAYRLTYDCTRLKYATVNNNAYKLLQRGDIITRVDALKFALLERHNVTVDSLLLELEEARMIALKQKTPQTSAAVAATMGKAKLVGLDKQLIDITSSDGSMTPAPTRIELVAPNVNTED